MVSKKAYAKLNLYLEVLNKREDGYHNIKSVFAKIGLYDNLVFNKRNDEEIKITIKNNVNAYDIPTESNLVYKAVKLFKNTFGIKQGVDIILEKNIPLGAGLGGGSSDCATALLGVSELFNIKKEKEIFEIGKSLGSDVPFFLKNVSFALCEGRGEIVSPINSKAVMPHILLVFPGINVSTKEIYQSMKYGYQIAEEKVRIFMELAEKGGEIDFSSFLFNRLEETTFKISPEVLKVKEYMSQFLKAVLMSGSGSSVFAVSYDYDKINKAYLEMKKKYNFVYLSKFI